MTIEQCPNPRPDCPYYTRRPPEQLRYQEHGCFSDIDHLIPRCLGRTALAKAFINLPENKERKCRWEHDDKTHQDLINPPSLPSVREMQEAISWHKKN